MDRRERERLDGCHWLCQRCCAKKTRKNNGLLKRDTYSERFSATDSFYLFVFIVFIFFVLYYFYGLSFFFFSALWKLNDFIPPILGL